MSASTSHGKAGEKRGPLAGVRVLDLSRVLAGPFCSMILADLGAEVIKIEELGPGDQTRTIPPFVGGESHYFLAVNRNKMSVALDARRPEGRDILLGLARHCDVVLENFRPGVMERLGLGHDALKAVRPDIILCSISGFGSTGPMRDKPSFDLVTQALSGVMSINGYPDGPPTKLGVPMGDVAGGLWSAIGVLSALQHRNSSGGGLRIDLSLLDGLIGLLGYLAEIQLVTGESPGRMGNQHHNIVPYGLVPVKDGHMVLALHVGNFWRNFCRAIGREDLIAAARYKTVKDRLTNRIELEALIAQIMQTKTSAEWHDIFDRGDVPHGPVYSVGEALEQEAVRARGLVKHMQHPSAGDVRIVGSPLQFPGAFDDVAVKPAPLLGEHTRALLAQFLGYDDARIDALVEAGVLGVPGQTRKRTQGKQDEH